MFVPLVMLGLPAFVHAQGTPCGYTTGSDACPASCNYQSGVQSFQFVSTGGSFGVIADVYCGNSCGYVQTGAYLTTPCTMESPVAALPPEVTGRLLALADGRQMLISSCGGFRSLGESPEGVAQARWKFPKVSVSPLVN